MRIKVIKYANPNLRMKSCNLAGQLFISLDFSTTLKGAKMRFALLATLLTAAIPAFAQSGLTVDWDWKVAHRCNNTSPALSVSGVPDGTKSLSVQMNDLDYQNKDHGGGNVPHAGGSSAAIPEGELKANYLGPCPNNFSSFGHSYQITVRALAADGAELAKAVKAKDFSAQTAK
jgi:phosphatidylethanolamine-binding protein (PEBP) family uncharacterized protein